MRSKHWPMWIKLNSNDNKRHNIDYFWNTVTSPVRTEKFKQMSRPTWLPPTQEKRRHYLTDFIYALISFCLQSAPQCNVLSFVCLGLTLGHGGVVQIVPDQSGLEGRAEESISRSTVERKHSGCYIRPSTSHDWLTLTHRRTFCSAQQSGLQILWCRAGAEARWVPQLEPRSVWQFPPGAATSS